MLAPAAPSGRLRTALLGGMFAAAWLLACAVALTRLGPGALGMLPALALLAPLMLRTYPCERILVELREVRHPRRRSPQSLAGACRRTSVLPPRGGLLLGRSLAVRPPPAPALG